MIPGIAFGVTAVGVFASFGKLTPAAVRREMLPHLAALSVYTGGIVWIIVSALPVMWWAITSEWADQSRTGELKAYGLALVVWYLAVPSLMRRVFLPGYR